MVSINNTTNQTRTDQPSCRCIVRERWGWYIYSLVCLRAGGLKLPEWCRPLKEATLLHNMVQAELPLIPGEFIIAHTLLRTGAASGLQELHQSSYRVSLCYRGKADICISVVFKYATVLFRDGTLGRWIKWYILLILAATWCWGVDEWSQQLNIIREINWV